ncbi:hypothetical protein Fmac_012403 [Flemingia macrophylla]|uniref:Leucine-rich repeat domain, L domain-containing protein n=1 Tax=Flemingia macrophylla TaxID=520843 RepID=A0ABD1MQ72_9FABA
MLSEIKWNITSHVSFWNFKFGSRRAIEGTYAVEAIWFDMTHMSQIPYLHLRANVFKKTPNLRLLVFQSLKSGFKRINSVYLPEGLSKYLVRSPNLSHAPNLKIVSMSGCKRLAYVHPSVFSLPKLRLLNVYNCQSLKSLSNNTWSQSLKYLGISKSGLNELSPSIFPIRNLTCFFSSINNGLADLPEHFAEHISLCDPIEQECDTLSILHKVLPSSGFQSVTGLSFLGSKSLCKLPDISFLSSLHELYIYKCTITILPESIKYLERLKQLLLSKCKMLQHIPALPESILCLHVLMCESLETVSSSSIEPSKRPKFTFLLPNCIKLDERSYDAILKDSLLRIELGAKALSAAVLENEEDAFGYIFPLLVRNGKICYCFPARSDKVREWFHFHFTQSLVNIELPPNLLGFIFYSVVFQVQSRNIEPYRNIGCECYLETSTEERIKITSLFVDEFFSIDPWDQFQFTGDHVLLWYDAHFCKQIMEVIKGRVINDKSTTHYPKLAFKFFSQTPYNDDSMIIKECGFRWVYSLEEGECNCKKSIDILEAEETLPPK